MADEEKKVEKPEDGSDDEKKDDARSDDEGDVSDDEDGKNDNKNDNKAAFASQKRVFMSTRDVASDVPDDVWIKERKCLLMLLEARMLLREMVEYKLKLQRMLSGNLTVAEIQNLLAMNPEDGLDNDFISEIQELKRQLVKEVRRNHALERELAKLDQRIALLIANRTSIQEIDRAMKKKKKGPEVQETTHEDEDFSHSKTKLELYSNLFYCLQVEPKYLAKLAYVMPSEKTESFMDTLILTLFGDAFSPREEYLLLQLFKNAMEYEIGHIKNVLDLIQSDTVVPKMVLTYNKRKQGVEYLKNTLTKVLTELMQKEYNFELKPVTIYQKMVNDMEVKTGKKTKMKRDVTDDEAQQDPNVKQILSTRTKELQDACQLYLDKILATMNSLPYGLRLICSQISKFLRDRFPKAKPDEIWQIVGYFVYYRFINLAVVQPDSFDIGGRDLSSLTLRKNLVTISKVLQALFRLDTFKEKDELAPLNPWITSHKRAVTEYFSDLIAVPPPEDYLQVNQYMELTQKSKPLIIISAKEVVETHSLLDKCADQIVKDKNDPLQILLKELGSVPRLTQDQGERELQLTLENRFKGQMEDEIKPGAHQYAETKELIIQVFKAIPIKAGSPQTLKTILEDAATYAKEQGNKVLQKNIAKILKNFVKLEEQGLITPKDNYTSLLKDVALEVTNRAERREQQQKEIARLQATLKNLKKHQEYMNEQIGEFEKYLDSCRKSSAAKFKGKSKPVKFPYKDLAKKGVIIDSEVPEISRGRTKFFITMTDVGVFDIEAKIAGMSVGKMQLELEDLLEKKENNILKLELDQVSLNVQATIFLVNKYFLS